MVERDQESMQLLQASLVGAGFAVTAADSEKEALAALERTRPDLVMLGLTGPVAAPHVA